MPKSTIPDQILDSIVRSKRVAVVPHNRPDVDALGSSLAIVSALNASGRDAKVYAGGDILSKLRFLPGFSTQVETEMTEDSLSKFTASDLVIVADTHEPTRVGVWWQAIQNLDTTHSVIVIDHHRDNDGLGNGWVDPEASSTSEMVFWLLERLQWPITQDIAVCLAAGIVGDTSHFTNSNSSADVLRAAAYLVERGADLHDISMHLDDAGKIAKVRLWGQALADVKSDFGGQYVWTSIALDMLSTFGVKEYELEGLSNYLRTIHGVAIAAAFFEQDSTHTRVSLRAISGYDVQAIASQFPGGGGRGAAAGCVVPLPLEATQSVISEKVSSALK